MVKLLLKLGAYPAAMDKFGRRICDRAKTPEIAQLIRARCIPSSPNMRPAKNRRQNSCVDWHVAELLNSYSASNPPPQVDDQSSSAVTVADIPVPVLRSVGDLNGFISSQTKAIKSSMLTRMASDVPISVKRLKSSYASPNEGMYLRLQSEIEGAVSNAINRKIGLAAQAMRVRFEAQQERGHPVLDTDIAACYSFLKSRAEMAERYRAERRSYGSFRSSQSPNKQKFPSPRRPRKAEWPSPDLTRVSPHPARVRPLSACERTVGLKDIMKVAVPHEAKGIEVAPTVERLRRMNAENSISKKDKSVNESPERKMRTPTTASSRRSGKLGCT